MSEMSTIFVFTTKTTQPCPQFFSVNGALINLQESCTFDNIGWLIAKFFQIWSSVTGYGEIVLLASQNWGNILNE